MSLEGIWQISHFDLTIRVLFAVDCGGGIGIEREWSNHAAGFRTHILVCVGSASVMLLSIYGFGQFVNETNVRIDPARLAAQVISGIGFLGAGAIMRSGLSIKGLTTAASIWVVAAIGLCIGAGFLYCAFLVTALVLISLLLLNKLEKHFMRSRREHELSVKFLHRPGDLGRITTKFGEYGIWLTNIQVEIEKKLLIDGVEETVMEARFQLRTPATTNIIGCIESLPSIAKVIGIDTGSLRKAAPGSGSQAAVSKEEKLSI